jgi:transcriptional regulator GlxA family with amidase domain
MTENALFSPADDPLPLSVLVLPHSSILEVASILDPMRAANRHLGREAFRWTILSPDGAPVPLTCGLSLPASAPLAEAQGEALIVVAGYRLAEVATRPLIRTLSRLAPRFRLIAGVDAAPWVLARAGLLDHHRATVHWEDQADLAAAHPRIRVVPDRFVLDRTRATIGGAGPAADFMLHWIARRHGPGLARQVALSFLTAPQPGAMPQVAAPDPRLDPRVSEAARRIEARLETPEPVPQTAAAVGLSARRLETLFRRDLGTTPGAYGLTLRLTAARKLLTETRHPLADIALRTGFSSAATLRRALRQATGQPPGKLRPPPSSWQKYPGVRGSAPGLPTGAAPPPPRDQIP